MNLNVALEIVWGMAWVGAHRGVFFYRLVVCKRWRAVASAPQFCFDHRRRCWLHVLLTWRVLTLFKLLERRPLQAGQSSSRIFGGSSRLASAHLVRL